MSASDNGGNDAEVERAVAHIKTVQERCGTRLVQVDAGYPIEGYRNGDVNIEYLVRDVLQAARPDRPETQRELWGAHPGRPDREPQPSDGPDYHADHAAWEWRQTPHPGRSPKGSPDA